MIYFYNKNLYSGGAETLIYRILVELKKRNIPACVVCETCAEKMKETMEHAGVDIRYDAKFAKNVKKNDLVIVFSLKELIEYQIRLLNKGASVILYMVGLYTLTLQRLNEHKIASRVVKPIMSKYIQKSISNRNIIFMDRLGVDRTERYYGKTFNVSIDDLFPLPIEIEELPADFYKERLNRNIFSILSIARADFPFKGYLKGLIEECTLLNKETSISLTLISYGKGMKELMDWVKSAEKSGFNRINIIGETSYEELNKYIISSNLYVGMATTVLDAAKRGVISIAVQSHTYELKSNYFFHENPCLLGEDPENELNNAIDLIRRAINMPEDEYIKNMIETVNAVKRYYSKEQFMEQFMELVEQKGGNISEKVLSL